MNSGKTIGKLIGLLVGVSFVSFILVLVVQGLCYSFLRTATVETAQMASFVIPLIGAVLSGLVGVRIISRNASAPLSRMKKILAFVVLVIVSAGLHYVMAVLVLILMYVTGLYRG
ncbi:MAG: hypothetical protein FWG47_00585 [Propionibacteriaceae bacterium]|nr:hypothetical protein [Propionibacteriaceae bacterium]